MEPLPDDEVEAYLARIEVAARPAPTLATLRDLHRRHLLAVPFENLSIHRGEPISLAPADLFDKIVTRGLGGFCYELNGLFAALLTTLGFEVSLLAGRVFGSGGLGPPFDHLALLVTGEGIGPQVGEPQYRLETRPRDLPDFGPTCWWQQTSPGSHFRAGPVCSRLTATGGHVTLAGRRLTVTEGGQRDETVLGSDVEVLAAYRERFGIVLDRMPTTVGS